MFLAHFTLITSVLHTNGRIHGNISPNNIFLANGGIFRLGDIGIVPAFLENKKYSHLVATPYSAPEVASDKQFESQLFQIDIFCILFQDIHLLQIFILLELFFMKWHSTPNQLILRIQSHSISILPCHCQKLMIANS